MRRHLLAAASLAAGALACGSRTDPPPDEPPAIERVVVAPEQARPGELVQLVAVAASGAGLPLSYRWTVAGEGWAILGEGPYAVVTAPAAPGCSAIAFADVEDAAGASAHAAVAVATSR